MTVPVKARLLDLLPAVPYGLETLLRLLDVQETEAIPTAAVPLGGDPRLLINPRFVEAHCRTDEELFALILHELHHVLLGHTRLFERVTPAHNLAFDAIINALICRAHPQPAWTSLFRKLYRPDRLPDLLLRPPEGFPRQLEFPPELERHWRCLLIDLYQTGSATFEEIFHALTSWLRREQEVPTLLGHHDVDPRGVEVQDDPGLFAAVRAIVDRWPTANHPSGRSLDTFLREHAVMVNPPKTPVQALKDALTQAARDGGRCGTDAPEPVRRPAQVAWPTRDRRAFGLRGAGSQPLLYATELPARPRPRGRRPVHVYVDVSPSCLDWVRHLYEAVLSCRRWVAPRIYLFSTCIEEASLADLRRGHLRGTGGTAGSCVSEHLVATDCQAAVVLTDGYVGAIPEAHHDACRRARLQVVLTPKGHARDLAPVATIHRLEAP